MILEILWERGQAINLIHFISLMISGYWTKDVLFWEKDYIYIERKETKASNRSRMIRIRYDGKTL